MPVGAYVPSTFTGNAVTTVTPYNFKILDQTHLKATLDGVVKTLGADYTVDGVGASNGGNVTWLTAPGNGVAGLLYREVPYTRTEDYQANGDLREQTLDKDLDLREMQIQQLAAIVSRALKAPASVSADQVLSAADWAARNGMVLGFDGSGNLTVLAAVPTLSPLVSAFILTLLDDANAAAARATLGVSSTLSFVGMINGTIVASRSAGAETVAIKTLAGADPSVADPVSFVFRDAALATGGYVVLQRTSSIIIQIPSTATMGMANGVASRLWLGMFNNGGGALVLALVNCLSGQSVFALRDDQLYPATDISAAADNGHVIYSFGISGSKAFRILGYLEYTLAAAGTWDTAPSKIQLFGPGVTLPGQLVQEQVSQSGALASGATTTPYDDTIPQITEGTQFMTQAITPRSAANLLEIEHIGNYAPSAQDTMTVALHQDAVANALAAIGDFAVSASGLQPVPLIHRRVAGSVSALTFRIRAGCAAASVIFNGYDAGTRRYGGVCASILRVKEIMS